MWLPIAGFFALLLSVSWAYGDEGFSTEGSLLQAAEGSFVRESYIAIIIDDLGHHYSRGVRAARLPASLTYAILPYSTHAARLAKVLHASGKEIIVHLPMENIGRTPIGPGGLTQDLNRAEFDSTILKAISRVPHAIGINNHMGSALTQQRLPMEWLMEEIGSLDFYFVDSRTTPATIAATIAKRKQLLSTSRDIFLDNNISIYEIDKQFQKLVHIAKEKGTAVAIGHPYPETLAYLEIAIPLLNALGVKIVPASAISALQHIYPHPNVTYLSAISE